MIEIQKSREGRSNQILKRATIEEMLRPEKQNYGLGFDISERGGLKQFGHGGADAGFQALLSATVDGCGIVVMTNSDTGGQLAFEIKLAVAAAYGWQDKPREREAISMTREALEKFAGDYVGLTATAKIRVEGDHLVLTAPGRGDVALYPQSADSFFSLGGVPDVKFETDGLSLMVENMTLKRVK